MQGDSQKVKGDADIAAFGKVMQQNSKQGNPRGADQTGGGAMNANYTKGSIEKDVSGSKGTNVNCNSTIDANYMKK